jgi:hypothetical protein
MLFQTHLQRHSTCAQWVNNKKAERVMAGDAPFFETSATAGLMA